MSTCIKWDITYRCNLNCTHCANGNLLGNVEGELVTSDFIKIVKKLKKSNISFIHMLGGEPTARKDFVDIMKYLSKEKLYFGFNTNGMLMDKKEIVQEIKQNKYARNIVFSLESPYEESNDLIRGKKVFEKITNIIRDYVFLKKNTRQDLCLTINTVLSKQNKNQVIDMIKLCIELGVDELTLLQLIPEGNAGNSINVLSFDDEKKIVEDIASVYGSVKGNLKINPRFVRPIAKDYCEIVLGKSFPDVTHGCGAGTTFAYIDNKGLLYPCDRLKSHFMFQDGEKNSKHSLVLYDFSEVFDLDEFGEIYRKTEDKFFYKNVSPCNFCDYLKEICFPCPVEIEEKSVTTVSSCKNYMELIQRTFMNEKDFSEEIFELYQQTKAVRVVKNGYGDAVKLFNTNNSSLIEIDQEAYRFFEHFKKNKQELFVPKMHKREYIFLLETLVKEGFLSSK